MTSCFNGATKQNANDIGYYINIGDMRTKISAYNATTNTFTTALWSFSTGVSGTSGPLSTQLATTGASIFKDLGKTVISSNRTFRKVQLVYSTSLSTNGVGGRVGTTPNEDYYTGYIELGFDGTGLPAPVAHFGR